MAPGIDGAPAITVTDRVVAALMPHELEAVTLMLPFSPVAPDVTVMAFVPWPDVIVQPVGTVHV